MPIQHSGHSSLGIGSQFLVSRLDDQVAHLKAKDVSIERTTASDYVKTATVSDPSGNRVVFAELVTES